MCVLSGQPIFGCFLSLAAVVSARKLSRASERLRDPTSRRRKLTRAKGCVEVRDNAQRFLVPGRHGPTPSWSDAAQSAAGLRLRSGPVVAWPASLSPPHLSDAALHLAPVQRFADPATLVRPPAPLKPAGAPGSATAATATAQGGYVVSGLARTAAGVTRPTADGAVPLSAATGPPAPSSRPGPGPVGTAQETPAGAEPAAPAGTEPTHQRGPLGADSETVLPML